MAQIIVTYIIVFVALAYTIYRLWFTFRQVKKNNVCTGCASCPAKKEIQVLITKNKNRK